MRTLNVMPFRGSGFNSVQQRGYAAPSSRELVRMATIIETPIYPPILETRTS
jgi:hypothetical protein